jgi:S-(hydroxymethyl)glutathione dehydrogenase/alcohol dehydrogenase
MPHDQRVSIHTLPLHFGRKLTGSEGGKSEPETDIPAILQRLAAENVNLSDFVTHRGSINQLPEIMDKMRRGDVIHAILTPS